MKKKPLEGMTFGRLQVLKETDKVGKDIAYLCLCSCGKEKRVSARHLRSGATRSCGCFSAEIKFQNGKKNRNPDRNHVLLHGLYAKFKNEARKRGIEMSMSFSVFSELVLSDCFYCGDSPKNKFVYSFTGEHIFHSGIDRVDSNKGYSENNSVPCCWMCNCAKNKYSTEEFVGWLVRVMGKFGKTETFVELSNEDKNNI